nr:hypothetical protein HK105_004729 [Polyrhizophydium stewartii]
MPLAAVSDLVSRLARSLPQPLMTSEASPLLLSAVAAAVAALAFVFYRNSAVGSGVRLPKTVKRPAALASLADAALHVATLCSVRGTLPIIGALVPGLTNYNRLLDFLLEEGQQHNFEPKALIIPFTTPLIFHFDPASVEFILKTEFEHCVKGDYFVSRMKQILGETCLAASILAWPDIFD